MRWNLLSLRRSLLAGASLGGLCWALACSPAFGQEGTTPSASSQPSSSKADDTTPGTTTPSTGAKASDSSQPSTSRSTSDSSKSSATRSGRDGTRDAGQSSRDALKETRDSVRDATRDDQDPDDRRSARSSSPAGQSSQRSASSRSSDEFDDIHGGAASRSTRDSSREDSRRDSSREDQSYSRGQREDRDSYQRDDRSRDESRDRDDSRDSRQSSRDRDFDRSRDPQDDFRDSRDDSRSSSRSAASDSRFSSNVEFRAEDVRPADIGLWFDRSNRDSLVISDVSSSGAITRFGFREGDQILSINGWRVSDQSQFVEYLFDPEYRNQRVEVIVWRGGRRVAISVQPSLLIQEYTSYQTQSDPLEEYGLVLDDRYPNYIVVWKVLPRTPAYYAGIRSGDTIVAWDGYRVSNPQQFTTFVQRGSSGPIDLQVSRNRQIRQLQLEMDGVRRTALRPNTQLDARGNIDVDRVLPGRENRIENRIERRDDRQDFRDGSFGYGTQGWQQGGTYTTQPGYAQPGVQVYGQGTLQGQPGVQAGAEVRPGLLPRARGR